MLNAIDSSGSLIKAERGVEGFCPGCRAPLIPKCGLIVTHHWAHQAGDCDPWYEPETEWHIGWKQLVRPECREVVVGSHRADIVGNGGVVIELQHSTITADAALEREAHYGNMIWIIDASDFWDRIQLTRTGGRYRISWRRPRKVQQLLEMPLYWHSPYGGLLHVKHLGTEDNCAGYGYIVSKESFLRHHLSEVLMEPKP